jgi:trans-aconitate 2-methyltransferase
MHTYQWNADEYAQSSKTQFLWARELIGKLHLKGDERILDIGSGDGKVTAEIARYLPNGSVIGIDSSSDMVTRASQTFHRDMVPNICFQQGDARSLSFRNEFDIIFSNAVLHWVLDHRPVLGGIHDGLKQGGRTLLQMGGKGNAHDVCDAFDRIKLENEWCRYFEGFSFPYGFYGPEEYHEWIRDAGLIPNRVELIQKEAIHDDYTAFEGWIRTTWLPYTQRVPEEKRNSFITELAAEYLAAYPADESGRVHVGMVRLEVEAYKP